MDQREVTAKVPEKKDAEGNITQKALGPVTVIVPFPESLEEALGWCSEEAMLSNSFANWRVLLQSGIRNALKAGKSEDQVQEEMEKAVMGVARQGGGKVDVQAAYIAKFRSATPEEQAKMLEELRENAEMTE